MLSLIFLQADGGNAGLMNILMIVLLIGIFYFFMIRPQQKKAKEIKKFRESLTEGSRIVTAGGIYGKIKKVKETSFIVEIAPNVNITIDKGSVYQAAADAQNDHQAENHKV